MLAVTPPGRGERVRRAAPRRPVPHRPAGRGRRGRPRGSRPTAPRAGCGGRPRPAAAPLVDAGVPVARAWDVAEAHRLLHGGWSATAGQCWAAAHGIPVDEVPAPPTGDLFEFAADAPAHRGRHARRRRRAPARRPRGVAARPGAPGARGREAALETAHLQHDAAAATSVRLVGTVLSESAAAVLCLELRRDGLPIDRARTEQLLADAVGPAAGDRGRGAGHPARPRRARAAARARPGVDRPAQPRPGARAAARRGGRRAEHPQVGARAVPHGAPAGRRPARLAPGRADRHDLRLPVARRARRAPTTGCAGGGRRATARPAG